MSVSSRDFVDIKQPPVVELLCGGLDDDDEDEEEEASCDAEVVPTTAVVEKSACLFLREFKKILQKQGFDGYKYNRSGKAVSRKFRASHDLTQLKWETKRNNGSYDALAFSDVVFVEKSGRTLIEDRFLVTIHAKNRLLLIGFDLEKRGLIFADGLRLLLAEGVSQPPTQVYFPIVQEAKVVPTFAAQQKQQEDKPQEPFGIIVAAACVAVACAH